MIRTKKRLFVCYRNKSIHMRTIWQVIHVLWEWVESGRDNLFASVCCFIPVWIILSINLKGKYLLLWISCWKGTHWCYSCRSVYCSSLLFNVSWGSDGAFIKVIQVMQQWCHRGHGVQHHKLEVKLCVYQQRGATERWCQVALWEMQDAVSGARPIQGSKSRPPLLPFWPFYVVFSKDAPIWLFPDTDSDTWALLAFN